jgi:hypothetical protein
MNDHIERDLQDGIDPYLYTVYTLDVDIAASMTADEFAAEMQRLRYFHALQRRAETRRSAHRRAFRSGAVRLVRRALWYNEPTLNNCGELRLHVRRDRRQKYCRRRAGH